MNKEQKVRVLDDMKQVVNEYYVKVNFDNQHIVDLIREYPNDLDLGKEIRKYYNSLKND